MVFPKLGDPFETWEEKKEKEAVVKQFKLSEKKGERIAPESSSTFLDKVPSFLDVIWQFSLLW